MPVETLTDARVRGLEHADGEVIDARSGLIVRADRTGVITFSYRYRSGAARRRVTIGRFPAVSLAEGRSAVARLREAVRTGADPQQDRRARSTALTFDQLADSYLEIFAKPQKSSWRNDEHYLRRHVRPAWGRRAAASIARQDAAKLLIDIVARAPVSANRTRSILVKLFGWAVDNALLTDSPMLGTKKPYREGRGKTRVLRDDEIRVLWGALDRVGTEMPGAAAALRVMLLLGQRPGETVGMAVAELVDIDNSRAARWELPAERMKGRKPHIVPLPPLAVTVIKGELARQAGPRFVFASRFGKRAHLARCTLSYALGRAIAALERDDEAAARLQADPPTPHDLRRTLATGLSRIGIPRDDRLAVLAHSYGDVHSVYDHHDRLGEKRTALETWERHVAKLIAGDPGGAAVIPLRAVAP